MSKIGKATTENSAAVKTMRGLSSVGPWSGDPDLSIEI